MRTEQAVPSTDFTVAAHAVSHRLDERNIMPSGWKTNCEDDQFEGCLFMKATK